MAEPSSEIKGEKWKEEVGSILDEQEQIRREFYEKRAKLKLEVSDIKAVLDDPEKAGFKTLEELEKGPAFAPIEIKSGNSLFKILNAYFTAQGSDKPQKETYLSLHYLNTQKVNVDYLEVSETVKIEKGRLTIVKADGTERIKDALLRPKAAEAQPVAVQPAAPQEKQPAAPAEPVPPVAPPVREPPPLKPGEQSLGTFDLK